jgi:MurNAc alpha-1-phosphate uridylyltransferase
MNALLLAAGRGSRMRPLTDHCPKPLLPVRGKPLLQWTLEHMARDGIQHTVINTGWLGEQVEEWCFSAPSLSAHAFPAMHLSMENRDFGHALETAGGIARALPQLGDVFWLAAGDVFAPQFRFDRNAHARFVRSQALAHLWLVPNPEHHPSGDFALAEAGQHTGPQPAPVHNDGSSRFTYSTIGLFRAELFTPPWCDIAPGNPLGTVLPLGPLLRRAAAAGRITGEVYHGEWVDVGTPQRLAALNDHPV